MATILIVDDENAQRRIMADILRADGYGVQEATGVDEAVGRMEDLRPEVVLTDLKMPGRGGLALIEEVNKRESRPEIVVITAFGSIETAVRAMRMGAYDYLNKPIERDELLLVVQRAVEKFNLRLEGRRLREEMDKVIAPGLIAQSHAMRTVLDIVARVAQSDSTILITGESGTGKERIAQLIHSKSLRASKPMQCINCAAFPETLLESELFGYEKGAFTGANNKKIGIIESTAGSSLFLDEVGDMSLSTQTKILRVLQEKQIRRVGGTTTVPVDVRIIAASNKNLENAIQNNSFREDLFYRLNVIPIVIPPLRERREDIEPLARFFLGRYARKPRHVDKEAMEVLRTYDWPGNVRELEAIIERISILCLQDTVTVADLPPELSHKSRKGISSIWELPDEGIVFEEWEHRILAAALQRAKGNMAEAAKLVGMTYRTFQYRSIKFGLKGN